jgi:hypothetical protein
VLSLIKKVILSYNIDKKKNKKMKNLLDLYTIYKNYSKEVRLLKIYNKLKKIKVILIKFIVKYNMNYDNILLYANEMHDNACLFIISVTVGAFLTYKLVNSALY